MEELGEGLSFNTLPSPAHQAIRALSGVVVAVFAFGLPVAFGYILLKAARSYKRETSGTNAALARRVAEDLKVDEVAAEFVIRDVIIGEDYSFLMDACAFVSLAAVLSVLTRRLCALADSPRYLYWEGELR